MCYGLFVSFVLALAVSFFVRKVIRNSYHEFPDNFFCPQSKCWDNDEFLSLCMHYSRFYFGEYLTDHFIEQMSGHRDADAFPSRHLYEYRETLRWACLLRWMGSGRRHKTFSDRLTGALTSGGVVMADHWSSLHWCGGALPDLFSLETYILLFLFLIKARSLQVWFIFILHVSMTVSCTAEKKKIKLDNELLLSTVWMVPP